MKKMKVKLAELEIHLGDNFHKATIFHPLTGKVYELLKTQRFYNGKSIHGLTLKAVKKI